MPTIYASASMPILSLFFYFIPCEFIPIVDCNRPSELVKQRRALMNNDRPPVGCRWTGVMSTYRVLCVVSTAHKLVMIFDHWIALHLALEHLGTSSLGHVTLEFSGEFPPNVLPCCRLAVMLEVGLSPSNKHNTATVQKRPTVPTITIESATIVNGLLKQIALELF